MSKTLRIGGLDGLNAAPLLWGLAKHPDVSLVLRSPGESAAALVRGEADVALVPSIEVARNPLWSMVPGLCIAARRRVRSVILVTRGSIQSLRTVAVDETSRTSVALLQILLTARFGVTPRLVPQPAHMSDMLADADGALLIADAALRSPTTDLHVHDLAELWAMWTGLPFVFAVWATRPGLNVAEVEPILQEARTSGLLNLPQLVAEHATCDGNPGGPELTAYLGELLHFALTAAEESSLQRFFAEAHQLNLIPEPVAPGRTVQDTGQPRALAGGRS